MSYSTTRTARAKHNQIPVYSIINSSISPASGKILTFFLRSKCALYFGKSESFSSSSSLCKQQHSYFVHLSSVDRKNPRMNATSCFVLLFFLLFGPKRGSTENCKKFENELKRQSCYVWTQACDLRTWSCNPGGNSNLSRQACIQR